MKEYTEEDTFNRLKKWDFKMISDTLHTAILNNKGEITSDNVITHPIITDIFLKAGWTRPEWVKAGHTGAKEYIREYTLSIKNKKQLAIIDKMIKEGIPTNDIIKICGEMGFE